MFESAVQRKILKLLKVKKCELTNVCSFSSQEGKEGEAAVEVKPKPTPAFEEHSILPNGLHEDAQANLISVPLAEVDKSYGQNEVILQKI